MNLVKASKGNLLVAEPSIIGDMSFNRAVILLAENNASGSVGFILNKPLAYKLGDIIPELDTDLVIYNGGPVEQDNLYFIHCVPDLIPDSIEISHGIYWGGDFDVILDLLKDNILCEDQIQFFLGYSGWEYNQLNQELEVNSWVVSQNIYGENLIAKINTESWKEKMLELGGDYKIWSNAPENPNYN